MDEKIIAFRDDRPQTLVEHPMSVRGEGEAVAGVVVSRDGMLMNVGGLDDGGCFGVETVTGQGAGEVVAAENVALEAAVPPLFLASLVFGGMSAEGTDFIGARWLKAEAGREHDLFDRGEIDRDQGSANLASEVGIPKAVEERGMDGAQAGGGLGGGGLNVGGEALPHLVSGPTEGVEGHWDVRLVALAFANQLPVVAEPGNKADIVGHPTVRDVARVDEVDDGEKDQWFMGGQAALLGPRHIQVAELSKPICTRIAIHDENSAFVLPFAGLLVSTNL